MSPQPKPVPDPARSGGLHVRLWWAANTGSGYREPDAPAYLPLVTEAELTAAECAIPEHAEVLGPYVVPADTITLGPMVKHGQSAMGRYLAVGTTTHAICTM
jgi:hypothetical protein